MKQPQPGDQSAHRDDDFAQMLKRVRDASGMPPGPPRRGFGEGAPPPKDVRPGSRYSLVGPAVILAVIVFGVFGLARLSTWIATRMVVQGASADNPALRRQLRQQDRLARWAVPVDTTISPLEAGRLLHAISRAGADSLQQWERPTQPRLAASTCCTSVPEEAATLFDQSVGWPTATLRAARRGLTATQRAHLRGVSASAALPAFRRLSRARAADLGAALYDLPADSVIPWPELPRLAFRELGAAATANAAAAALDLEAGRVASAETRLREIISVGLLLRGTARSTMEEAHGGQLVRIGRTALEALYRATGRIAEADAVSSKSDSAIAVNNATRRVRAAALEETLRRRMLDSTELTGIRWQLRLGPFAYLPCTSIRQALFGPSASYRATQARVDSALVKLPSDTQRLNLVVRGVPQMIDPYVGFRQRNAGRPEWAGLAFTLTRSRQLERCAALFRR